MSDEKKYTEREMVRAQRDAFVIGWHRGCSLDGAFAIDIVSARTSAEKRYPLPKIARQRVLVDARGTAWKVDTDDDKLVLCYQPKGGDEWFGASDSSWTITQERAGLWLDLLTAPTEDVEDES